MGEALEALLAAPLHVVRPGAVSLSRPEHELARLDDDGIAVRLAHGYYALVPEPLRRPGTEWRPTIEAATLGIAAALHGRDHVSLVGPSAARLHRAYPRALAVGYAAVPSQLSTRETIAGTAWFITRSATDDDLVRLETDLGAGWATSVEQTALDLAGRRPDWKLPEAIIDEMLDGLLPRIDWDLADEIAAANRRGASLHRLHQRQQAAAP